MTERVRPESVPAGAWWSEADKEWIHGLRDAQGRLHGPVRYWRPDGTLLGLSEHVAGRPHGRSMRFHESGEESQECTYVDGALHGTRTWFASDGPTTEGLHTNGVSPRVRRMEMEYEHGDFITIRYFDRDGNPLCRDGTPLPPRPATVEPTAQFHGNRWVSGKWTEQGHANGRLRHYTREGVLVEDTEWRNDRAEGAHRAFDATGELREQCTFHDGKREGTATAYRPDGTRAREAELSGGEYHGALRDYDASGTHVVREVRFVQGVRQAPPVAPPPAPVPSPAPPRDWRERLREEDPVWLDLSHVGLERLPDELRGLRRLKYLNLVNNRLRALPAWLMELESLDSIKLALNRLPLPRTGRGVLAHFRRTRELPAPERRVRFHLYMGDLAQARSEADVSMLVSALGDPDPSVRAHAELALAGARPSPLVPGRRVFISGLPRQRTLSALRRELEAMGLVVVRAPGAADVPLRSLSAPLPELETLGSQEARVPGADVLLVCGRPGPLAGETRPIAVEADLSPPSADPRELARHYAAAQLHPDATERRRAWARFRKEAPPPLWAFLQSFTAGLANGDEELLARRIRLLGRSGHLDRRTLAEEVFRHTGRGASFFIEEGGPQAREVLAKAIQKHRLDLSYKGLTRLPPELGSFADLTGLNLESNKLTTLPDELGDLFSLHELNLSFNPLTALPAGLARLSQLRKLSCNETKLTPAASEPLFALTGLTDLSLDGCGWDEAPEALGQLTRLRELYLGGNRLKTLPASVARLQRLTYLHLTHSDFETLPPAILELRALKSLWLESCNLRELPADITRLAELERLCVWFNRLESIPLEALTRLPRLRELRIRDNPLSAAQQAELRAALPRCTIY